MEKIFEAIATLKNINSAYGEPVKYLEELEERASSSKVCTPVIGKFSYGKSALINTILGYKNRILKEDITPETSIPAEILYTEGEDEVFLFKEENDYKVISLDEYRGLEIQDDSVKFVRMKLRRDFLEEIPDVMLVDMPGFESGIEVHNRAIDNYVSRSLAFIVTFPADDMIVRSSVGNMLKELCLHDMPLCVAITKCDKKTDDFKNTLQNLNENLRRFIGNREVKICETSSRDGNAEELKEFLREIQADAQNLLSKKFKAEVFKFAEILENHLKSRLQNSKLSESELNEKEDRLKRQMDSLNSKLSKEGENFDIEVADCIEEIKNDVRTALEGESSSLTTMVLNNQGINERINQIVRSAVTTSVKKRLIPMIEKHLRRTAQSISSESIGDISVAFSFNLEDVSKDVVSTTVAAVTAILVGGPIIGGIIAGIIAWVGKWMSEKKREEARNNARKKLQEELFPQILDQVGRKIDEVVMKQVKLINTSIEEEIKMQRESLEKAITDVRAEIQNEKERKENEEVDIKNDLERLEMLREALA